MRILQSAETALRIAAVPIIPPLFLVFIVLFVAYCLLLDWLGITKKPEIPDVGTMMARQWEAERQQRQELSAPTDQKAA